MTTLLELGKNTARVSSGTEEELGNGFYLHLALALMADDAMAVRKGE